MTTENEIRAGFAHGTVSQSAADVFAAQMRERGLDPTATLRAHGFGQQQQQQQQPSNAGDVGNDLLAANPHVHVGTLNASKHPSLSQAEIATAYANWVKQGLDPKAFEAAAAADGWSLEDIGGDANATELETSFDDSLGGAAPQDYQLDGAFVGRDMGELGGDLTAIAGLQRDMRDMLSSMAYPKAMAGAFVADVLDANSRGYASLQSDYERHAFAAEQKAIVMRATQATSYEDLISTARVALARIPEHIAHDLAERGVFEDARVLAQLFRHGERLILRDRLRQSR